jgi:predicted amidophosphoribosyltransferase
METTRIAAYTFTNENDIHFSPEEYSQFKFGSKSIARKYGHELWAKFISTKFFMEIVQQLQNTPGKRIVVMASPFVHIPTATWAMKDYFVRHLNRSLYEYGLKPIIETKIFRESSYKEEYGEMNKEQRMKVMSGDTFKVDAELLKDNVCLFLDDIVITGAHEHRICQMLTKYGIDNGHNYFLYFAELLSENTNPVIENYLNYYYVKNLVRLNKIIENHDFQMNTRVVKYILDASVEDCTAFLNYQSDTVLQTLYHNAIGNEYNNIESYKANFAMLEQKVLAIERMFTPTKLVM